MSLTAVHFFFITTHNRNDWMCQKRQLQLHNLYTLWQHRLKWVPLMEGRRKTERGKHCRVDKPGVASPEDFLRKSHCCFNLHFLSQRPPPPNLTGWWWRGGGSKVASLANHRAEQPRPKWRFSPWQPAPCPQWLPFHWGIGKTSSRSWKWGRRCWGWPQAGPVGSETSECFHSALWWRAPPSSPGPEGRSGVKGAEGGGQHMETNSQQWCWRGGGSGRHSLPP